MPNTFKNPICPNCNHVNQVFCALSSDDDTDVTQENSVKKYVKGDTIFVENNYPTGIHILVKGKIKIVKTGEEGKEQIVRFAGDGDLLGYRSLLGNRVYKASAIALSNVRVCHIPEDIFLNTISKNQWLYLELLKKLSNDLANAENIILSISQKTVRERIAEAIIILYYKFGHDNDTIKVKLTRKDIANMAGTTIESTIRTLSNLKKDNFIEFNGKKIIVQNIQKLIELSHYHSLRS